MNKVVLEKALQIGFVFGILKITIQSIKLIFSPVFLSNSWFHLIFNVGSLLLVSLIFKKDSDLQNGSPRQKLVSLFFVLQISTILSSVFEIYVHEVYDMNYKYRIAQQSVERLKAFDEDFEKRNHAQIVNKGDSYVSETEKIAENFSLKNLLSNFYFALTGNIFLMFIIYFLSNLSFKKMLSK